jgi:hypothetical protein
MIENPPALSEVPLWRKVLITFLIAACVFLGAAMMDKQLTIYGEAPDHPVAATGQVYGIQAMHHLRYVTLQEKANPLLRRAGSWCGAAFVVALFLWITSPKKTTRWPM